MSSGRVFKNSIRDDHLKGLMKSKDTIGTAPTDAVAHAHLDSLGRSKDTIGISPIDVAAHLNLLGHALTGISETIAKREEPLSEPGINSVFLDFLLCAIGPLLCLTSEIVNIDNETSDIFKKILDHLAYFMPGL